MVLSRASASGDRPLVGENHWKTSVILVGWCFQNQRPLFEIRAVLIRFSNVLLERVELFSFYVFNLFGACCVRVEIVNTYKGWIACLILKVNESGKWSELDVLEPNYININITTKKQERS